MPRSASGELLVLVPGPARVDRSRTAARVLAGGAPSRSLVAALVGALLYLLVFRPLREAPELARAVASLGVLVVIQGTMAIRLGTATVSVRPIFPDRPVGARVDRGPRPTASTSRLTIVGLTLVLAAAFKYTRFGLATRAVAETQVGAYVSGVSPDRVALAELDDQRGGGRRGRDPHRPDQPADAGDLHAVRRARAGGRGGRSVPVPRARRRRRDRPSACSSPRPCRWCSSTPGCREPVSAELVPLLVIMVALLFFTRRVCRVGASWCATRSGGHRGPGRSCCPPWSVPPSASWRSWSTGGSWRSRRDRDLHRRHHRAVAGRGHRATPDRSRWRSWPWPVPRPSR